MALDTKAKRSSSLSMQLPVYLSIPDPDGSFGKADRMHQLGTVNANETPTAAAGAIWLPPNINVISNGAM